MPTPNAVITVIREWVVKAENDLKTAAHTLTLGDAEAQEGWPSSAPFFCLAASTSVRPSAV